MFGLQGSLRCRSSLRGIFLRCRLFYATEMKLCLAKQLATYITTGIFPDADGDVSRHGFINFECPEEQLPARSAALVKVLSQFLMTGKELHLAYCYFVNHASFEGYYYDSCEIVQMHKPDISCNRVPSWYTISLFRRCPSCNESPIHAQRCREKKEEYYKAVNNVGTFEIEQNCAVCFPG